MNGVPLTTIPFPDQWPGKDKTLVVVDDMELKTLKKEQRMALDRLFGYVSTHKNISVRLSSQNPSMCLHPGKKLESKKFRLC